MPIRRDSKGRFAGGGGGSGRRSATSKRSTTKDPVGRRKSSALKASSKRRAKVFGTQVSRVTGYRGNSSAGNRRRFGQSNLRMATAARRSAGGSGASVRASGKRGLRVHRKKR